MKILEYNVIENYIRDEKEVILAFYKIGRKYVTIALLSRKEKPNKKKLSRESVLDGYLPLVNSLVVLSKVSEKSFPLRISYNTEANNFTLYTNGLEDFTASLINNEFFDKIAKNLEYKYSVLKKCF